MYIYIHTHTHIHTHKCTYIHMSTYINIYIYMYLHIHSHIHLTHIPACEVLRSLFSCTHYASNLFWCILYIVVFYFVCITHLVLYILRIYCVIYSTPRSGCAQRVCHNTYFRCVTFIHTDNLGKHTPHSKHTLSPTFSSTTHPRPVCRGCATIRVRYVCVQVCICTDIYRRTCLWI